jgi:nucleoside-diphosphate-sugar epimerase
VSRYGQSKLFAEGLVEKSGIPYIIIRPTMVYGPDFTEQFRPVLKGILNGKMRLVGSGSNRMSIVHQDDAAQAFVDAVASKVVDQDFIISNGPSITQEKAMGIVAKALGVNPPKKSVPVLLAVAGAHLQGLHARMRGRKPSIDVDSVKVMGADRWFDTSKAKRLLGWEPRVDPKEGLAEMARVWLKGQKHVT